MKQVTTWMAFFIMTACTFNLASCAKGKEDCKTCQARSRGEVVDEAQVCGSTEEAQFRSAHSDAEVTCK